jgi:protoporphyrinogen oxidase
MRIAIVGAGISGVSAARLATERGHEVTVYEQSEKPGGLVKCDRVEGHLFHRVGGHVFNSKNEKVNQWFWSKFNRDTDFIKTKRKAGILLGDKLIGYPIENYLFTLDKKIVRKILDEVLALSAAGYKQPESYPHFEAFLRGNFGDTLYDLYFGPYNKKIWRTDLRHVALPWLEGKLPMPNYTEMLLSNIVKEEESAMVHSTFYYPVKGGSQFTIDTIANGLKVISNTPVKHLERTNGKWTVNKDTGYDAVVFTGDVRTLANTIAVSNESIQQRLHQVTDLKSNGTSNMLCETDETDLSWLYLPNPDTRAHRIIYTGNFSTTNNAGRGRRSCVVEFSGSVDREAMESELKALPGNLKPVAMNQEKNSYVIQDHTTRERIATLKTSLEPTGFYLCGRFAEWEYYNMDKAIEAAMALPFNA